MSISRITKNTKLYTGLQMNKILYLNLALTNLKLKKFIFILFIFALGEISAQQNLSGCIIDVGTHRPVTYAEIRATPSQTETQTDESGGFNLQVTIDNPLDDNILYIISNRIFWKMEDIDIIEIYDLKSSLAHQRQVSGSNSCDIPNLPNGYYILSMTGNHKPQNYLIYSHNGSISMAKKAALNSFSPIADTALLVNKQNYFSSLKSLQDFSAGDSILILKTFYDSLSHFNQLISKDAFNMLSSSPSTSNYGNIASIKGIHDLETDKIYYINVKVDKSHYLFAKNYLGYELGPFDFLYTQYSTNPSRYLNLFTINYHESIDKYVLEFSSLDETDCQGIGRTFAKVMNTSYFGNKLFFYCNNLKWKDCPNIPQISSEELYNGQKYQALNNGENYGYLVKMDIDAIQQSYLGRHDIVIINGVPNDLPVVAGIITSEFQTPLSHINILSHNRNTPNMAMKDAWSNHSFNSLLNKLVYLKVESDSFTLRQATPTEAESFWSSHEPQDTINLSFDTISSGLIDLSHENIQSVNKIGGKAANFAELVHLDTIPLPEDYFAIPMYYYWQHLKQNGIDSFIDEMLSENAFYSDNEYRKIRLIQLQNIIKAAPVDLELIQLIESRIDHFSRFSAYRFRSSTNAEDLENFSGAGLYASTSAKKDDPDDTIEKAIKIIWASLWDLRAFEERAYYKINHKTVAMAILVHRSFPNENANGVLITSNLYNINHGYTINCQYGEYSIVYPEPGILNDQIILYTISMDEYPFNIEYLTRSNLPELQGETVLTDNELYELGFYCTTIKNHYFNHVATDISCGYESFSVDIEFKIDSTVAPRKIYLKQARIYKAREK